MLHGLVPEKPQPRAVPALWRYEDVRPFVMESCRQISTAEAERRVMVLENPGLPGQSRITQSLFAGLQIDMDWITACLLEEGVQAFTDEPLDDVTVGVGEE